MISVNNLSFYFGGRALYQNVNLHIKPKDRIGLIGANGTGKSTLLKLLIGEYKPDEGDISKSGDCTIGFLNQDLLSYQTDESILAVAMQAFERVVELQKQIDEVLHQMEVAYEDKQVDLLTKLQEEFDTLDGYTSQPKAEQILEGLGFNTKDLSRPLKEFSGGWRMRVMLAKLLLMRPSLLMLDEPTNHLDLPSIKWIEEYLDKYEGAVIVVSHDRYFLDNVCNTIVEVSQQKLNLYSGNYSFYLEEKELRNEIQKGAYENQQSQIRQTEKFIERFKAKATKARQVQSRVKSLARLERIDDVLDENAKINFKFNFGSQSGRNVLDLKDVAKSYGELHLLRSASALIERGDKIALIGANGKGKSTVLRIIAGVEPHTGEREEGHNVKLSFFAQHQLESLNLNNDLLSELQQAGSRKTDMELRGILGCFLFSDDDVYKKIKVLSGGEKSRVAMAKVLLSEANFLLLDEPTNHLDMQSVNILIHAMNNYQGSFVTVSHDRHFVTNVANKIWWIEDMEIKVYPGTYDEWEVYMEERTENLKIKAEMIKPKAEMAKNDAPKPKVEPAKPNNAPKPNNKEITNKISKIEGEIANLEATKVALELELASPELYNNVQKLAETQKKYEDTQKQLASKEADWEALIEVLG